MPFSRRGTLLATGKLSEYQQNRVSAFYGKSADDRGSSPDDRGRSPDDRG